MDQALLFRASMSQVPIWKTHVSGMDSLQGTRKKQDKEFREAPQKKIHSVLMGLAQMCGGLKPLPKSFVALLLSNIAISIMISTQKTLLTKVIVKT